MKNADQQISILLLRLLFSRPAPTGPPLSTIVLSSLAWQ
jgi:hypothetical protein